MKTLVRRMGAEPMGWKRIVTVFPTSPVRLEERIPGEFRRTFSRESRGRGGREGRMGGRGGDCTFSLVEVAVGGGGGGEGGFGVAG